MIYLFVFLPLALAMLTCDLSAGLHVYRRDNGWHKYPAIVLGALNVGLVVGLIFMIRGLQ